MISLNNKVALITGGSRGIGAAAALMLAEAGVTVAFTYASKKKQAQAVADKAARASGSCLIIQADMSKPADVKKAVKAVMSNFGRIDILVNNAGVWKRGAIGKITEQQWDETLDINLKGTFLFCNEVVPIMKKQRGGKIINIASTAGQRGEAFYSHYAASKGGVIAFTKGIAVELGPHKIIANCVSPGWVDTDMTSHVLHRKKEIAAINKAIPRGKVATPQDIAGAVLFLASDLSNHIVGAVINVNGGSVLYG
ncbi:MAG: 3-oxoacyl-ACP reductase FabG [Ignavibacteriales bacterium]|nr:3-oxoacyl-ACP reductase FabG [Ignavibacteriales bacterium]